MTRKKKMYVAKNAQDLVEILGLPPSHAAEMDLRRKINEQIRNAVEKQGLTHAEVAKLAKTSRTRVTAILNGSISGISTDLMLRIVVSLGYRPQIRFERAS